MPIIHKYAILKATGSPTFLVTTSEHEAEKKGRFYNFRVADGQASVDEKILDEVVPVSELNAHYPGVVLYTLGRPATPEEQEQLKLELFALVDAKYQAARKSLSEAETLHHNFFKLSEDV